jgi:molecular chaperone DnaJ
MFRRGFLSVSQTCPSCGGVGQTNRHPCTECNGRGRREVETTLKVTVPPGVDSGMRLRLSAEGESGVLGGPRGDLYVVLSVTGHERYERDGADLHLERPISVFQAMLGDEIDVPTILDEIENIEVNPGTQPGEVVRLRGAGMPQLNSSRRGDMYVHFRVVIPRRLDSEQRRLIAEAANLSDDLDESASGGLFERLKRALGNEK